MFPSSLRTERHAFDIKLTPSGTKQMTDLSCLANFDAGHANDTRSIESSAQSQCGGDGEWWKKKKTLCITLICVNECLLTK